MNWLRKLFTTTRTEAVYTTPIPPAAVPTADYPVVKPAGLAPCEPASDMLNIGWNQIVPFGATVHKPLVTVAVHAPADPERQMRIAELSTRGLARVMREKAAGLPYVAEVRRLRDELAAASHLAEQNEAALASAKADLEAALSLDELTGPEAYSKANHALAVAEAKRKAIAAEIATLTEKLQKSIGPADSGLRAFSRSAAEMLLRQRREELLATVKQLDGAVFERILTLWAASNQLAAGGGDHVYHEIRDLLGRDLPAPGPVIVPDDLPASGPLPEPALPRISGQLCEVTESCNADGSVRRRSVRYVDVPADNQIDPVPDPTEGELAENG